MILQATPYRFLIVLLVCLFPFMVNAQTCTTGCATVGSGGTPLLNITVVADVSNNPQDVDCFRPTQTDAGVRCFEMWFDASSMINDPCPPPVITYNPCQGCGNGNGQQATFDESCGCVTDTACQEYVVDVDPVTYIGKFIQCTDSRNFNLQGVQFCRDLCMEVPVAPVEEVYSCQPGIGGAPATAPAIPAEFVVGSGGDDEIATEALGAVVYDFHCSLIETEAVDSSNGGTGCAGDPLIITRTYTVYADKGTADEMIGGTWEETYTWEDTEGPAFDQALPTDVTLECSDPVPAAPTLTATDACSGASAVTFGEVITADPACPNASEIVRTWTTADACGTETVHVQTITIVDTTAPTFDNPPADETLACLDAIPAPPTVTFADNCGAAGTATFSEDPFVVDNCAGYTVTRRWNAVDECGNTTVEHVQVITVPACPTPVVNDVTFGPCSNPVVEVVGSGAFAGNLEYTLVSTDNPAIITPLTQASPLFNLGGSSTGTFTVTDTDTGCESAPFIINFGCNLPIELIDFKGRYNGSGVDLTWSTASEDDNDYFSIEISYDGFIYNELIQLPGAGTSSTIQNYSHTIESVKCGVVYFRLKQTDFNGDFSYSDITAVKIPCDGDDGTIIYPNPFTETISIDYFTEVGGKLEINVIDAIGRIHHSRIEQIQSGNNTFSYSFSNLSSDAYFIRLRNDKGETIIRKAIKVD